MSNIIHDWIIDYLRDKQDERSEKLAELEKQAKEENIPVIEPELGNLLDILIKVHNPNKILELGTAIGYSTLWLNKSFSGQLTTIEINQSVAEEARDNFADVGYDNIEVLAGDALEILPEIEEKFDFIFIDAAKGQYINFLESALDLVTEGGLIVADDVLFKGIIADDRFYHPRYSTLTRVLREYVDTIMSHPKLDSTIIPIGDGLAISRKK